MSREIVQPLLEGLPDAAVVVGGDGVIRHANALAERLFGIRVMELVGGPLSRLVPRRHRAAHGEWVAGHVRSGSPRPMGSGELTAVHADGRELPVEISLAHWDVDGERLAIAMIRDVADRREQDARLAEAQRVVALGVLAAGLAHELNNPLTALLTNVAVMRERASDPEIADILRDTAAAAERIRDIVADVSRFSRPDRPDSSGADLEAVVESTLRILGPQLPTGCEVRRDYGSVPPVRGDEGRLAQIVLNLLLNAAQALAAPLQGAAVHVRTTQHQGQVVLEVQDTGPGMSPEVLGRLFTPFFTTRPDGTGLGLVITRRLVHGMGGRIDVSSAVGAGSTFRVTLPAVTAR